MRYWYDTEFLEDGSTIELISIGIVAEDGREYYAVNADMPLERIKTHDWLVRSVLPSLPLLNRGALDSYIEHRTMPRPKITVLGLNHTATCVKPRQVIANEVRDFLLFDGEPELWAWYGAYDHVVLMQLWGPMVDKPDGLPMWTNDLRQETARIERETGQVLELPEQTSGQHDALEDARHLKLRWGTLSPWKP